MISHFVVNKRNAGKGRHFLFYKIINVNHFHVFGYFLLFLYNFGRHFTWNFYIFSRNFLICRNCRNVLKKCGKQIYFSTFLLAKKKKGFFKNLPKNKLSEMIFVCFM